MLSTIRRRDSSGARPPQSSYNDGRAGPRPDRAQWPHGRGSRSPRFRDAMARHPNPGARSTLSVAVGDVPRQPTVRLSDEASHPAPIRPYRRPAPRSGGSDAGAGRLGRRVITAVKPDVSGRRLIHSTIDSRCLSASPTRLARRPSQLSRQASPRERSSVFIAAS